MAINYDQDIAPLRQQYFPMLMGERGFDQAMKYRQETLMPMQMHTMKLEQHSRSMRSQDLAYEKQKMDLQKAKEAAQRQNEALEFSPKIDSLVNGILDDDTLSPLEKSAELSRGLVDYAPHLANSQRATSIFGAAFKAVDSQKAVESKVEQDRLKAKALEEKDQAANYANMQMAMASGDDVLRDELINKDGVLDDRERAMLSSQELEGTRAAAAIQAAQQTAEVASRKARFSTYKSYYDMVVGQKPREISAVEKAEAISSGDTAKFELEKGSRAVLESIFSFVDSANYPPAKVQSILSSMSGADLHRYLLSLLSSKMAENSPTTNAANPLDGAFDE
jgi:hypothetical protein